MRYDVTLRMWERDAGRGWSGYFEVQQGGTYYRVVRVILRDMVLNNLYEEDSGAGASSLSPTVARAANRYAVRAIEEAIWAGVVEPVETLDMYVLEAPVDDETMGLLVTLAADKQCDYQELDGRDLYCIAASDADETATRLTTTGRRAAPTSRPLCAGCGLPDTDYICSHFLHPQVVGVRAMGGPSGYIRRDVTDGLCDLNRPEFTNKRECHAGGNPCWERQVDVDMSPTVEAVPPQAIEQALDDLDVRWRLAFGNRHVVRLAGAADVSVLGLPCASRDEFERRLSSLADIMKRLDIPDDLFPAETELPGASRTHDRLELLFKLRLTDDDDQRTVKQAIATLRGINQLRAGGQHAGDAQKKRARSADELGIPLDGRWGEAWELVRSIAAHAIRDIGDAAQRVVDQVGQ